ncbi:unnamed protein product [Cladocopium goreaui]|uniref:ABC transmembrane type-1 domain-containing protein n=1 Tax=Cladocopium goreaui TaxID=2562237 RepID=A0A9P1GTP5_9DINO|nr:unnamed protein product [Cladocopium goreaui]
MGVVFSLVELSFGVTGSLVSLGSAICGLHAIASGSAVFFVAGLREVHDLQESLGKLSADFTSRMRSAKESPQKAASVALLAPLAMLLWMISVQCLLAWRVVNVPQTGKIALPLLALCLALLVVAPRFWWYLMTATGCLAPPITWLTAEFSERPPQTTSETQQVGEATADKDEPTMDD